MAPFIGDAELEESHVSSQHADISISIDRGGTFCDVITKIEGQGDFIFKLLSEDPKNYADAPTEAIRRVLSKVEGQNIPIGEKLDGSRIGMKLQVSNHESVCQQMRVKLTILPSFMSNWYYCGHKRTP